MNKEIDNLDSITDRELEIIALLQDRLTNQEISDRLFLALSTVKWYIKQINSKLQTSNRYEIVERAEEAGLLSQVRESVPERIQRPRDNLPRQTTAFIGRDDELGELNNILTHSDTRLLTILAPGGMGKTRIALELAEQQVSNFPDGVYYVGLQSIDNVQHILPRIASNAGFRLNTDSHDPDEQVLDFLRDKQMLLMLDNFEHLLEAVGIVNEILKVAPQIKLIVTSRERLNLLAETSYMLQGMKIPVRGDIKDLMRYDAVQLLVQSARRTQADWDITDARVEGVVRLCQLTEGMPLGILLATSWLDIYALDEVCEHIQDDVDILGTEMHDVPARQRSIRAVFNYSWNNLKPAEQSVLMIMSIFQGGCTPDAAKQISGANPGILQRLWSKALLHVDKDGRYELHKLLGQYAMMQLATSSKMDDVLDVHMQYYATMLKTHQADLYSPDEQSLFNFIEQDFDNIRMAWQRAFLLEEWNQLAGMITPVQQYLLVSGHHNQGRELFEPLIDSVQSWTSFNETQTKVLIELVFATKFILQANLMAGDSLEALQRHGLMLARQAGNDEAILKCLRAIIKLIRHPDRLEETESLLDEALSLARKTKNTKILAKLLLNQALIAYDFNYDRKKSMEINQEIIALTRQSGDKRRLAKALTNLAVTQLADGDRDAIKESLQSAELIAREIGDIQSLLFNLALQRDLAMYQMELEEAIAIQDEIGGIENNLSVPWRQYTENYRQFFWLFLHEEYRKGLNLWQETQYIRLEQIPYALTNIPHGALYAGMCGDFKAYIEGAGSSLKRAIQWHDVPRLIYLSVPLLRMLEEYERLMDCARLLSAISYHPHTWNLVKEHPYIKGLEEQFADDRFAKARKEGESIEIITAISDLYDDAIAGKF